MLFSQDRHVTRSLVQKDNADTNTTIITTTITTTNNSTVLSWRKFSKTYKRDKSLIFFNIL
jgi:hypothetical protein